MQPLSEKKISTIFLKQGMYISNLDRPWLDTPFLIQGFFVKDDKEIELLKKYCDHVYIDTDRGVSADHYSAEQAKLRTNDRLEYNLKHNIQQIEYVDSKTSSEELPVAKIAVEDASNRVVTIMKAVKSGKKLKLDDAKSVVEPILESIIRNSEALMWLTQMRKKDAYTYSHSVDNCALAIAFGKHLGLPKKDLRTLAMGLLLMDIGKMKIPEAVLHKQEALTENEFRLVKSHVARSVDILSNTEGVSDDIVNIALTHHERFDGSGYPGGLVGTQTPIYGRMAAIIDCYDAMTSKRPYGEPISAYSALQEIYNWRDKYFQDELVEQFLQCLGVFPTGSLVEMHSGEVGIVLAQNKTRRMSPRVMLLLDKRKQPLSEYKSIDLMNHEEGEEEMAILRGLDPGSFGIDPTEYYL